MSDDMTTDLGQPTLTFELTVDALAAAVAQHYGAKLPQPPGDRVYRWTVNIVWKHEIEDGVALLSGAEVVFSPDRAALQ